MRPARFSPGNSLPADVQAALERGDKVAAMRLLRERIAEVAAVRAADTADAASAPGAELADTVQAVAAALNRGDHEAATRLLRDAVEQHLGPAGGGAAQPPQLSPGQQPTGLRAQHLAWAAALCGLAAASWYWFTH